jgi:hypothetical protein
VDLDAGTIHQVKSLGVGGRAMFVSTYFSLSVSIKVFPSGSIRGSIIYPSFDFWERKQTEGCHLANGSTIKSYALEHHPVAHRRSHILLFFFSCEWEHASIKK